jgi:iron complex outermembrane receptor protein
MRFKQAFRTRTSRTITSARPEFRPPPRNEIRANPARNIDQTGPASRRRCFCLNQRYVGGEPGLCPAIASGRVPTGGSARDNALAAVSAIDPGSGAGSHPAGVRDGQPEPNAAENGIELQDTHVFSPCLRLVAGIGARHDRSTRKPSSAVSQAPRPGCSPHVEYKPIERLRFNLGGYLERDQLTGSTFSRARRSMSMSPRTRPSGPSCPSARAPDLFEQRRTGRTC